MGDDDGNANDSDTSANALEESSDGIILTPQALQFQKIAKSMGIKFAVDANEANAYDRRDSDYDESYDEEDSDDLERVCGIMFCKRVKRRQQTFKGSCEQDCREHVLSSEKENQTQKKTKGELESGTDLRSGSASTLSSQSLSYT